MGVILCELEFMPLPMLLHIAGNPVADEWIDESRLSEFVHLAEPLAMPLQKRHRIDVARGRSRRRPWAVSWAVRARLEVSPARGD